MNAPFPYFGGKRGAVDLVWPRLGRPKQYIEPFCGSAAMLLGAREPAMLEVVNDVNGFIANFWRAVKYQPAEAARWADYPVSHIDLGARHRWLMEQRERLGAELQDPNWPGDAQCAGWWLWGQCCWIGSGWADWSGPDPARGQRGDGPTGAGQIPHASDAGMGVQAAGQIPHAGDAGRGDLVTSSGRVAWDWLHKLAARLERVRVVHGEWGRCLNHHYGADDTAVFLDPPYRSYESVYGSAGVADSVEAWARENQHLRVVLCGHVGDYPSLDGWDVVRWTRKRPTYSGSETTDKEAIWFSPACLPSIVSQGSLFPGGSVSVAAKPIVAKGGREELLAWIADCRSRRVWATCCAACGGWFEQDRSLRGRRAVLCGAKVCVAFERYRRKYGRAPPAWLRMRWSDKP